MPIDFWTVYWGFVSFVFGAVVGSFLNVCVWRLPRGESVSQPPSHCPACSHRLSLLPDMVPLLSQLWYRSRCRYCGAPFSWRYFWVELLTAGTFTAVYARYFVFAAPHGGELARVGSTLAGMLFAAALIVIFFIDLEHYEIPDITVGVALLAGVGRDLLLIRTGDRPLWHHVWGLPESWMIPAPLSLVFGLLALWLLWQFAALGTAALGREAMGAGDSLLLGAMGAFLLPWPLLLLAFLVAVFLGALGGVLGIWLAGREEGAAEPHAAEGVAAAGDPAREAGSPACAAAGAPLAGEGASGQQSVSECVTALAAAPEPGDPPPAHRGAAAGPSDGEQTEIPELPPSARWGRLWTVAGTWLALIALWLGAAQFAIHPARGAAVVLFGGLAAAGALRWGIRMWLEGDRQWLPAMDELFESDPGPRFIPFGPYLVAGAFVAMFFGRQIVEWYATGLMGLPDGLLNGLGWD